METNLEEAIQSLSLVPGTMKILNGRGINQTSSKTESNKKHFFPSSLCLSSQPVATSDFFLKSCMFALVLRELAKVQYPLSLHLLPSPDPLNNCLNMTNSNLLQ